MKCFHVTVLERVYGVQFVRLGMYIYIAFTVYSGDTSKKPIEA